MPLRPISPFIARCLISNMAPGTLPSSAFEAEWFANADNALLAAVMLGDRDATWRYVILGRDGAGKYQRIASAEGLPTRAVARAAVQVGRWEASLARSGGVAQEAPDSMTTPGQGPE
jgi:hypothetical protein